MKTWTEAEIDALGVATDVPTACAAANLGGRTKAFELLHRGELPFRVIKAGNRYVVPVIEIKRLLGLAPPLPETAAGPADGSTHSPSDQAEPLGANVRVMQQQRSRAP